MKVSFEVEVDTPINERAIETAAKSVMKAIAGESSGVSIVAGGSRFPASAVRLAADRVGKGLKTVSETVEKAPEALASDPEPQDPNEWLSQAAQAAREHESALAILMITDRIAIEACKAGIAPEDEIRARVTQGRAPVDRLVAA